MLDERTDRNAYGLVATAGTDVHGERSLRWSDAGSLVKLLRVHYWSKNVLVFVPVLTAHRFDSGALLSAALAALAFSFCASAGYIANDIVDKAVDLAHPEKRHRPLAAGNVGSVEAAILATALALIGLALAALVSAGLAAVLLAYAVATMLYSLWLKRVPVVDVAVLGGLHVLRVLAGAVAIGVVLSDWLLAFSIFLFLFLALLKRYAESDRLTREGYDPRAFRPYGREALCSLRRLAVLFGGLAVVVFCLYAWSDPGAPLYSRPELLLFACPLVLAWVVRAYRLAIGGAIVGDPVVFALSDKISVALGLVLTAIVVAAI